MSDYWYYLIAAGVLLILFIIVIGFIYRKRLLLRPLRWLLSPLARMGDRLPEKATVSLELGKDTRDKVVSSVSVEWAKRHEEEALKRVSSVIVGVGKYVPDNIISSESIEERIALCEKDLAPKGAIKEITGVKERRHISAGEAYSSDMAFRASQRALENAGIDADELDMIIFASASHDIAEPATANIIQEKLEAWNAHVVDVKNACNSAVNALDIMDAFIKTGRCRIGLVAAGEVLSQIINWDINTQEDWQLGLSGLTLGDGGGAMVVKASEDLERGIKASYFDSDGSMWKVATIMGGGSRFPHDMSQMYFVSQSIELAKLAMGNIPKAIKIVLQQVGWQPEEVNLVVPHQVTEKLIERVSKLAGIPFENCMVTVTKYGNTAAASIPIALAEAVESGRVKQGDKVLLVGGAAGWSSAVMALVL